MGIESIDLLAARAIELDVKPAAPRDDRQADYEAKAATHTPGTNGANPAFWRDIDVAVGVICTPMEEGLTPQAENGWQSIESYLPTRKELEEQPLSHIVGRLQQKLDRAEDLGAEHHKSSTGRGQRDLDVYYRAQGSRIRPVIAALQGIDASRE